MRTLRILPRARRTEAARMRILHFCKNPPDSVGGIEQVVDQLARGTAAAGAQIDVLHLSREPAGPPVKLRGYTVHRAHLDLELAATGFSLSAFGRFAALARKADVIHHHFPWPFADLVHLMVAPDKPSVLTYHSDIIRQQKLLRLYRPLRRRFLASVDRVVATSPNYLATSAVLQEVAQKVCVIPIGLDRAAYPEPDAQRVLYWQSRLGARFFLFVGKLRYYKGLHLLMQAAQGRQYPIAIVGAGHIESELKALALQLGVSNVRFLGELPDADKVALLASCCALVFPSHLRSEAFGVSLLEGAMFGKPLISSEIGTGTSFVNIGGQTGLVVPAANVPALRDAMDYMWANPRDAQAMGRRAARRYANLFTAREMVDRYLVLYQELVQGRVANRTGSDPVAVARGI